MSQIFVNIGWAVIFSFVGGVVGIALILLAAMVIPRLIDKSDQYWQYVTLRGAFQ
jgi:hypothetical protein